MKVLLCDPVIVSTVGGGQRVYNQLIRSNPNIEFHTFLKPQYPFPKNPPKNLVVRPWKPVSSKILPRTLFSGKLIAQWIFDRSFDAREVALQVAGESFDVADLPDYYGFGLFLRPAFEQFNVKCKKIALSLHGSCSTTQAMEWDEIASSGISDNLCEFFQYRSADIRYALSRRYIAEWEALAPERTNYLDPLNFINLPKPITAWDRDEKCNLIFIGRPEKRKGPDLFLEALKLIPKDLYGRAMLVGPDSGYSSKCSAKQFLCSEAKKFGINLENVDTRNDLELNALRKQRCIVFAPSRYDTFNLVAIESLFAGCPTVIGSGAGVVDFLIERASSLPFLTLDPLQPQKVVEPLLRILKNYDYYRTALNKELAQIKLRPEGASLEDIFSEPSENSPEVNELGSKWYHEFQRGFCDIANPESQRLRISGNRLARKLSKEFAITSPTLDSVYEMISPIPEGSHEDILVKLRALWNVSDAVKFDRVRIWNEIGRLERMRGNLNLWSTYKLRGMRALNKPDNGELSDLINSLTSSGFSREADAVRASQNSDSALNYLRSTYENNRSLPEFQFQDRVDQREVSIEPKVSIIVSLYNAADKLGYFLQRLSEQTIFASKQVEIILVDSGSPKNEKEVFQRYQAERPLPVLYVRSKNRETIQTAWNQGISLSRAPYLCFLGVDETLRPDTLTILAKVLDDEPALDWVTGDSLITEVDKDGRFVKNVMPYNRSGYHQDLIQLETCYLSWVGALYRKSIHSRFGYYDGSFRAAGDTEFKNRLMSKISSRAIPEMLGIFLNYPDERTTASPVAEIEDFRAWYLHRTLAGVQYTYADRPVSELEAQIIRCLGYRKSYSQSKSTDFEYANSLLQQLALVAPTSQLNQLKPGIERILAITRKIEFSDSPNAIRFSQFEFDLAIAFKEILPLHSQISGRRDLEYRLDIDNRYQQHHWPWRDEKAFGAHKRGLRYVWL